MVRRSWTTSRARASTRPTTGTRSTTHRSSGREDFLKKYHPRSNVESTFSAIKRKFGDSVRSKTDTAMKNEVLCKILAHNVCVCIAEWYALGIEPLFGDKPEEGPDVLRFARPG
jgi:hypothetical protein